MNRAGFFVASAVVAGGLVAAAVFWPKQDGVILYCATDNDLAQPILDAFEQETGIHVKARFDAEPHFREIKAKVLYVLVSSDRLYPPSLAPDVMAKLKAAGVDATYFLLESPYGHDATTPDAAKWSPTLEEFNACIGN